MPNLPACCHSEYYFRLTQACNLLRAVPMITLQKLKTRWLQARIAYHRRQAHSYTLPVVRSYRRERYHAWLATMALRHSMKAHALERKLELAGERI
jgi:hypothetical protein